MTEEEKKEVARQYAKQYYASNKDKKKAYQEANKNKIASSKKKYFKENKEEFYERGKKYATSHREELNKRARENRKTASNATKQRRNNWAKKQKSINPSFKLKADIRCIIGKSLRNRGYKKNSKSQKILGCSFEEFKIYLESKFESWMTWSNRGLYNGTLNYGWDIDHIIPLDLAKTEEDILKLNHYSNLQPLCSKTNRDIKKNK
jgi:hypothetical protein